MKIALLLPLLICIATVRVTLAQHDTSANQKAFEKTVAQRALIARIDSTLNALPVGALDTGVFRIADSLNGSHPSEYLIAAAHEIAGNRFNEGFFLYFVGMTRYFYYLDTRGKQKKSEETQLFSAIMYEAREVVNVIRSANIDNCISIIRRSSEWNKTHDYAFCPRSLDTAAYSKQITQGEELADNIMKGRVEIEAQWKEERRKLVESLDVAIAAYKKQQADTPAVKK